MRDHRKLKAFQKAKLLAKLTYRSTAAFPPEEKFGLTSQMRRCAVSIGSTIVEGAARYSQHDFIRFLDIAFGSSRELDFQTELSHELGFMNDPTAERLLHRLMR